MAVGDLYMIRDYQLTHGSVQVLNVYWYEQTSGTEGAQDLCAVFVTDVQTVVRAVQQETVAHTRVSVVNTDNPLDWFELAQIGTAMGQVGGNIEPPFVALAFRYNRASVAVRSGQKRIGGVPTSWVLNGYVGGAYLDEMANVAAAMALTLEAAGGSLFEPKIVRRIEPVPPSEDWTYEAFDVASVEFVRLSSQNTRKFGRGA